MAGTASAGIRRQKLQKGKSREKVVIKISMRRDFSLQQSYVSPKASQESEELCAFACVRAARRRSGHRPSTDGDSRGNLIDHPSNRLLIISSSPKALGKWGNAGSRYQGQKRGFSAKSAAPRQEQIALTSELPFLLGRGFRFFSGRRQGSD